MRVLCSSAPMEGVLAPILPLAEAFHAGGHEVMVAVGADLVDRVESAGLMAVAAGPSAMEAAVATFSDPAVAGLPPERQWLFGAVMFATIMAPLKLADLRTLTARWRPDLVVHATVDFAAPLLAAELGIPSVTCAPGLVPGSEFLDAVAERVAPLWRAAGLEPDGGAGLFRHRYLDPCPRRLQPDRGPAEAVARPLRPSVPAHGAASMPGWFHELGRRPVVYMSLGTVPLFNQPSMFKILLAELAAEDLDLIVTLGSTNLPDALGDQPANVHVAPWLPLATTLRRCDVVVCHAGAGTTLAGLASGLPLVLAPQGADQFEIAEACQAAGAAVVLRPEELSAAAVRDSACGLLGASSERAAARQLQAEIAAMPPAVDVIQDL
jgi:UDP:flavonoid glycosyltransferase YjiC (YdhE family)